MGALMSPCRSGRHDVPMDQINLGSVEPTQVEWIAAGVEQRLGELQTIRSDALTGFVALKGVSCTDRGATLNLATADALAIGFPSCLNILRQKYRPPCQ